MGSDVTAMWSLRLDLLSANVLVWLARAGRDAVLRPEADLYFFDRYSRLAELHHRRGNFGVAARLRVKAAEHGPANGGPPFAAEMAMPRPRRWVFTDARSDRAHRPPVDAA